MNVFPDGTPNYGGHAFPVDAMSLDSRQCGMTLRQWYAGQAMAAFIVQVKGEYTTSRIIAAASFQAADAMIAHERNES